MSALFYHLSQPRLLSTMRDQWMYYPCASPLMGACVPGHSSALALDASFNSAAIKVETDLHSPRPVQLVEPESLLLDAPYNYFETFVSSGSSSSTLSDHVSSLPATPYELRLHPSPKGSPKGDSPAHQHLLLTVLAECMPTIHATSTGSLYTNLLHVPLYHETSDASFNTPPDHTLPNYTLGFSWHEEASYQAPEWPYTQMRSNSLQLYHLNDERSIMDTVSHIDYEDLCTGSNSAQREPLPQPHRATSHAILSAITNSVSSGLYAGHGFGFGFGWIPTVWTPKGDESLLHGSP